MREWCSSTKFVSCSCFFWNCEIDNCSIFTNSIKFLKSANRIRKMFENMTRNQKILTIRRDGTQIICGTNILNIYELESCKSRICVYEILGRLVVTVADCCNFFINRKRIHQCTDLNPLPS